MEDLVQEKLTCSGCGASLAFSPGAQALKCQFCHGITEIERKKDQLDDTPKMIVPLTVEKRDLELAVNTLLASGDYTPDDLVEAAVFSKFERFYVPAYIFKGEYEARWTASFGYDRTEHYTDFETQESDGKSQQVPVTRIRTVTDWSPANGTDVGTFSVIGYAGSRLEGKVVELVEGCAGDATEYKNSFTSGFEMEAFALTNDAVYDERSESQVNKIIDHSVQSNAQGDCQRDWHWSAKIVKDAIPVAFPVCHVVYEYDGKTYNVWTDGTNTRRLIADPLPHDKKREVDEAGGFAPMVYALGAMLLAGLLGEPSNLFGAFSGTTLSVVAVAWVFAMWRRQIMVNYSRALRSALLAEKTAASSNLARVDAVEGAKLAASFQRPAKPWPLDKDKNNIVLLIAIVVFTALVLLLRPDNDQPVTVSETPSASPPSATAPESEPAPEATPEPAAAAQEAPAPDQEHEAPSAASEQTHAAAESEAGAQPAAAFPQAKAKTDESRKIAPLLEMLNAAGRADWDAVNAQVQLIRHTPPVALGDRKAAQNATIVGLAALDQNNYAAAIAAFSRAIKADASHLDAYDHLAFTYLQTRAFASGLNVCANALQIEPERASTWLTMAQLLSPAGNRTSAIASLRLAVHFSPSRQRTIDYLNRMSQSDDDEGVRAIVAQVVRESAKIP
ncbi:zinc finger domain-containing protein [Massilia horti]|uniref:Uncharacterized protein n=1 Tax=Massilia horti TaxID=2562153 RepID=A0A4Y9T6N9_9BURK|nr:hypothetical protein [Massilia horti]TFW34559.1 hypothetical protein E4O92_03800 [Massilia horti]